MWFGSKLNVGSLYNKMNKNKPQKGQDPPPPTTHKFYLGSRERYIIIDCSFEAGNIQLVRQMSEFHVPFP